MTSVMADPHKKRLDASTAVTKVGVDYYGRFVVKVGQTDKSNGVFYSNV